MSALHWTETGKPVKRSLSIAGHKTGLSLEDPFWKALKEIAAQTDHSVAGLIGSIDEIRFARNSSAGLSSTLRVFVLEYYRTIQTGMKAGAIVKTLLE